MIHYFEALARLHISNLLFELARSGVMVKKYTHINDDTREEFLDELSRYLNKQQTKASPSNMRIRHTLAETELVGVCFDIESKLNNLGWVRTKHSGHNDLYSRRNNEWPLLVINIGESKYRIFLRGEFVHHD